MLSPPCYCGWRGLPLNTYRGSQNKGDNEKNIFKYMLSQSKRVVERAFGILSQKFQIYQRTLQLLPENEDIIFATCTLHSYLSDQGVGLSAMGSYANDQSNITKMPKQECNAHWSAVEVTDKFKQIFNSPSGSVPWQNKTVQCCATLQYSVFLSRLCHHISYLTCHLIPHIYAPILLIFHPLLKTNLQHSLQANSRSVVEER